MAILKIKVIDASGTDLPGQTVKVSGIDALQTNAQGMVQFLIENGAGFEIFINGKSCWLGDTIALAKQEIFQQSGDDFTRVSTQ